MARPALPAPPRRPEAPRPPAAGARLVIQLQTPAENTFVYNWKGAANESAPIPEEVWERAEHWAGRAPEDRIPGTYWLRQNPSNDYLIDRELQRTKTFTGITGLNTQDFALQEGMGSIVRRDLESLGSTDRAVQACRELLLEAADEVAGERDPLRRRPEHELARVQDQGVVLTDLDELGELFLVLHHVDHSLAVVPEHPEEPVDMEVHRRRLDTPLREGIDDDAAGGKLVADRTVGQDHGRLARYSDTAVRRAARRERGGGMQAGVVQRQNISFPS